MSKKNIKIFLALFFLALFLFSPMMFAHAVDLSKPAFQGIVPCGTDESDKCTLCHFIVGIQRLIKYGLYLVTTATLAGIFIGGMMYLVSAGNEELLKKAKGFISATLQGFAIILGAWIIVNTIFWVIPAKDNIKSTWFSIECSTVSSTAAPTPAPAATNPANTDTKSLPGGEDSACGPDINGGGTGAPAGKCVKTTSCETATPPSELWIGNGAGGKIMPSCKFPGLICCIPKSTFTIKNNQGETVTKCGMNEQGTCKIAAKTLFFSRCPDGWAGADIGNGRNCPWENGKETLCCKTITNPGKFTSETCQAGVIDPVQGKCWTGSSSCPENQGWTSLPLGKCSSPQDICCQEKVLVPGD